MSEAMDAMLKIGITEPESEIRTVRRQPNSVGYALPENCPKDGGVRTFRFTSVAGRRQALNPQEPATLFLPLQSASHLRPCDAGGHARAVPGRALGKEGIMHATLSPSWKKSLLLVFVSVVAFVTATPATSGPQCFFQGLGFLPGRDSSSAAGVSANGTVVVGFSNRPHFPGIIPPEAFRWTAASGMVGLGSLPGGNLSGATGVNADGTVVVGTTLFLTPGGFQQQAFRWTEETGMVGLDFLPGGNQSRATGVSANGKVVVGEAVDASGREQAFRWTAATRMQSVLTLLLASKVVTMADFGWRLESANAVSADGTVIVGDGVDPLGHVQGWIARLPKESNEDCEEDDDNQGDNNNQGEDFGQ